MSVSLEPSGKRSSQSFVLDNSGGDKIAVQISMAERKIDAQGVETNPDADDDFIVYPSQLVLAPNEKRTVRVTWAAKKPVTTELAYRIIAEQLPVDTEKPDRKKRAVIRMLLRYLGAVYITPQDAEPKLELTGAEPISAKGKDLRLALEVRNTGKAHGLIRSPRLRLTAGTGQSKVELSGDALKGLSGQNILAGATRRFELAWPAGLARGTPIKAELAIDE